MRYAKYGFIVLTLALVIGFSAPRAAAQEQFTGNFTLTTEAYWGGTLLPPGDYSIAVSLDKTMVHEVRVKGEGIRASILTVPISTEPVSDRNKLELDAINGVYVIRQLDAGLVGQSYRFVVSKNARAHAEQVSAASHVTVPVAASSAN